MGVVSDVIEAVLEFFSLLPGTITALLIMLCDAVPVLRAPLETLEAWLEPVGLWMVALMIFGFLLGWLLKGLRVRWVKKLGHWIYWGCTVALMLSAFWAAGKVTGAAIKKLF